MASAGRSIATRIENRSGGMTVATRLQCSGEGMAKVSTSFVQIGPKGTSARNSTGLSENYAIAGGPVTNGPLF
jgi:hypothetical protein